MGRLQFLILGNRIKIKNLPPNVNSPTELLWSRWILYMDATCGSIEIAMHFCMFQVAMQSFSAAMLSNGFEIAIQFICTCSNINGSSNNGDSGDVASRLWYISACSMRRGGDHSHTSSGIKFFHSLWLFWLPVLEFQSVKFLLYIQV